MVKLRQFQKEGVRRIYEFKGRALLADDMGLGKTIQALFWIYKLPKRRPVLIITPSTVKYGWRSEASNHFDGMNLTILEGRAKKRTPLPPGSIFVINYDILDSWLPVLLKAHFRIIVLDEAQYVKTVGAKRTKAAQELVLGADSVLVLSGTPMTNRPIELWPALNMVRPDLFTNRYKFAWKFCKPRHTFWGWVFDGASNKKKLHKLLVENVMIRRLKKDVAKELPDKVHKIIPLKLRSYAEYNEAVSDFLRWLTRKSPAKAMKAKKSQAMVKVGYLLRLISKLKMDLVIEWLREFEQAHPGTKLVGLTMHTAVIDRLLKEFPNSVFIDGRVKGIDRQHMIRRFQNDKKITWFWGNWKAAGIGTTLTAAWNLVGIDQPWTPGDLLQGQDRIHRIGQKKKVIIYYLVALSTIEEKYVKILQDKSKDLEAILNGKRSRSDLDIYDRLLDEIAKTKRRL